MFKLKRKAILVSSIMAPVLPIIAVVSCNHEDEAITSEALTKEAEGLSKANFHYDGKAFDDTKKASDYSSPEKVSGAALSKDTTLTATKIEVVDNTKLEITYKLKNGDAFSEEQKFTYPDFKVEEVGESKDVKSVFIDQEPKIKATEINNELKVLIGTLTSEGNGDKVIPVAEVDYVVTLVKKGSESDIKDSFEIVGDKLYLLAKKALEAGTYSFEITSQAKDSKVKPLLLKFDVVVEAVEIVKKVDSITNTNEADLEAVGASNALDFLLATLVSKDDDSKEIDKAKLEYKFTSVKKDAGEDDIKANFKIVGDKLYLEKGKALDAATYKFTITSKVKDSSDEAISEEFNVIIKAIRDVDSMMKVDEVDLEAIESSNASDFLLATLTSKDGSSKSIDNARLEYEFTSVKKESVATDIKANFKIVNGKLYLKKSTALEAGTYTFVITSKAKYSNTVAISKNLNIVIAAKTKDVAKISQTPKGSLKPIDISNAAKVLITTLVSEDEDDQVIPVKKLVYAFTSVKKASESDIKDSFEIVDDKLYLLKSKTLLRGTYTFVITSQTKGSSAAVSSSQFDIVIQSASDVDKISETLTLVSAVGPGSVAKLLIATLTSKDNGDKVIPAAEVDYEIVSVKKDSVATNIKANFEINIADGKLYLLVNKELASGKYAFEVSSKTKGSSTAAKVHKFNVDVTKKDVESISEALESVSAVGPGNVTKILIAALTSKDEDSKVIPAAEVDYEIVSVKKDSDANELKANFEIDIADGKLYLSANKELASGTYAFEVSSQIKSSEEVASYKFQIIIS